MNAVIDVGSNTVRLLIGECRDGILQSCRYHRRITRLAGAISADNMLAEASMSRTIAALQSYSEILESQGVTEVKAVGTAALRRAANRPEFIDRVRLQTGIAIDVIDGLEEARLMATGALSVIDPRPESALIIDIGGGSTEFVCVIDEQVVFQKSYPMGVVQLCEEFTDRESRHTYIKSILSDLQEQLEQKQLATDHLQLIGTAGTITTLAAIDLKMTQYDPALINNHHLDFVWLNETLTHLCSLTDTQREELDGMEKGRGDLIVPGLEIVCRLVEMFRRDKLIVADSGLMEGALLDLQASKKHT